MGLIQDNGDIYRQTSALHAETSCGTLLGDNIITFSVVAIEIDVNRLRRER